MLSITRTKRADEDLISIWLYVGGENQNAADQVLDAIERRWRQLAEYLSGVARDDIAPGIRHLIAGHYMILYRVGSTDIEIVRVLHGRRSIEEESIT